MRLSYVPISVPGGGFGSRRGFFTAAVALAGAVAPLAAVGVLVASPRVRRFATDRFLPAVGRRPELSRRILFVWAGGFLLLAVVQAVGAYAGPLSMLTPSGLFAHTLFALCGEGVMAAGTLVALRRSRAVLAGGSAQG